MLVTLAQCHEDGRRLPRHRLAMLQPTHQGEFSLFETHDPELRRSVRCARVVDPSTGQDVLPRLVDAVVLWGEADELMVRGDEMDEISRKWTAQAWRIKVVKLGL